ncbi:phage holin, LLH family [Clostridium felsineum]|uniref:Uncharacterized protein n=1 Tax=Clostridium felsineum TaxID=36839 RepID=A0A1S8LQR8_9CLOT|nr:phage holin, LLH family [Clostridium felsineum]URZ07575.1 hypothetical protein CLROS_029140 [Clostridium felsineum]URZ12606.1 hypothetical protein CROST_033290 [Clostridium felsineum]
MEEQIINQIIVPILGVVFNIIIGIIAYYVKQFYNKNKNVIELQENQLKQKIGIDRYNQDIVIIKQAVAAVEQMGKEFNWTGEMKNSKVLALIEGKTGLTDEEIYNVIKAAVLKINTLK